MHNHNQSARSICAGQQILFCNQRVIFIVSIRILIYGDSNSWGYLDDGSGTRFEGRWPVSMASQLLTDGHDIELIEECLPGRTTNMDDPQEGAHFNGATPLQAILLSQQPLDHVLIMLGTNDLKARFARSAADIVDAQISLARTAAALPCGPGGWANTATPAVTLICPPCLGIRADDPDWQRAAEWLNGRATSTMLPNLLAAAAQKAGIGYIDGNDHAASSALDPIHWTGDTHIGFGTAMAAYLAARL